MKAALVLISVALASIVNGQDKMEARENMMKVIQDCNKGTISHDRVRLILRHESTPQTKDEKCVSSCVLLKFGLIKDGQIDAEGWKRIAAIKRDDPSLPDKVAQGAALCRDKVGDSDPCEMASKVLKCIYKTIKQSGVPPPDFPQ